MVKEVLLEDFEEFYKNELNEQFAKIRKVLKKQISDIRNNLIEIKISVDHFLEAGKDKIEEKSLKSLYFFSDRIKKEIDDIEIPEDENLNYDNLNKLVNSIKKLFTSINDIAKKSLPKFQKIVQPQIKELNYITRKLGKKQAILEQLLRKKYTNVKSAEDLLKKFPKFFNLKENIENAKAELDSFEKEYQERKEQQEKLNSTLMELEKNDLFKKLEIEKDRLFKLRLEIDEQLGFKKALKKMKVELEKGTISLPNINSNYLTEFLKNPISTLIKESKDLPEFYGMLTHLRRVLEDNKLILKTDKKEKTLDQINAIFDHKHIQADIEKSKEFRERIKEIQDKIEKEGLAKKMEDVKNQISINSIKLDHIESDLERRNKDYTKYLATLKQERENFQNSLEEILHQEVKINIKLSF